MQEKDRFLKKQINFFIFSILFFIILYCKNTTGDEISSKVGSFIKDLNFFSSKFIQSNGSSLEEGYIYIKDTKVVYGDTDSIFVKFSRNTGGKVLKDKEALEYCIKCGLEAGKYITEHLHNICTDK